MRTDRLIRKLREPGHKETGKRFLNKVAENPSGTFFYSLVGNEDYSASSPMTFNSRDRKKNSY